MDEKLLLKAIQYSLGLILVLGTLNLTLTLRRPMTDTKVEASPISHSNASISSTSSIAPVIETMADLRVDCLPKQSLSIADSIKRIRLYFKDCGQKNLTSNSNFELLNSTNGYTGALSLLQNQTWTTDYIDLNKGDNHIQLTLHSGDKALAQHEIVLLRTQPLREPAGQ